MPTKTVSLTDEAYLLLMEIPKGEHSVFVTEAILAVSKNDKHKELHRCRKRLALIEAGLQSTFPVAYGTKTKRNPSGDRRCSQNKFFEFMRTEYLNKDDPKALEWWLA